MLKRVSPLTIGIGVVGLLVLAFIVVAFVDGTAADRIGVAVKEGLMLLGGGALAGLVGLGLIKVGKAIKISPITMIGGLCIAATVIMTLAALAKFWDALSEGANVLGL